MAIKKCIECGEGVSEDAKACPHCGKEDPTETIGDKIAQFITFIVIVAAIFWWSPWSSDNESVKTPSKAEVPVKIKAKLLIVNNRLIPDLVEKVPAVEITAIVDVVTVKNIIINNGNCKIPPVQQKKFPKTIKYGQKASAGINKGCNILKVEVITDKGNWVKTFDFIPQEFITL